MPNKAITLKSEAVLKDNSCCSITQEESKWNWKFPGFLFDQAISFKNHFINMVKMKKSLASVLQIKKRHDFSF